MRLVTPDRPPASAARGRIRWDDPLIAFLAFVIVPSLILFAIVTSVGREPSPATVNDKLALAEELHNTGQSKYLFLSLIESDSANPEYHHGYIESDHELPRWRRSDALIERYRRYSRSAAVSIRDIGHYGLGLIAFHEDDFDGALRECGQVKNEHLPYLNNLVGRCYMKLEDYHKAADAFRLELENGGYVKGALRNLSHLYIITHDDGKLQELAADQRYRPLLRHSVFSYLKLRHGNLPGYMAESLYRLAALPLNVAILIVLTIWFGYFASLRAFEPRRIAWMLMMLAMVVAVDMGRFTVYYLDPMDLGKNLLSSILGIGLIEESVKLIPVLLVYRFSKQVREPLDLLILGCMSGLGFAFWESLQWAQISGPGQMIVNTVSHSIGHMALTSVALYGLIRWCFGGDGRSWRWFASSFAISCILHGIYDYLIVGPEWYLSAYAIDIAVTVAFGWMLNQAIIRSTAYQPGTDRRLRMFGRWLGFALAGTIMAQFTVYGLRFGPANVVFNLWSMFYTFLPIMILSCMAGYFHTRAGRKHNDRSSWRGIDLPPYTTQPPIIPGAG